MPAITIEQLQNASIDADALADIVNGAANINGDGYVPTRLGDPAPTIAKLVQDTAWRTAAQLAYYATRAEGVAVVPVGEYFSSAETGNLRVYKRTAVAPYYVDQGDAAVPATQKDFTDLMGPLYPVIRYAPRAKRWTSAVGMNNPLGLAIDCNGVTFNFSGDHYSLADWTTSVAPVATKYLDYVNGNDANNGNSAATAWKTFNYAVTNMVDKTVLHLLDHRIGLLSKGVITNFGTKSIKLVSDHPDGTIFTAWRESYDQTYLGWVADGAAYKTTASIVGGNIYSAADDKYRDMFGLPLMMPHVASIALCKATPGTWNWDSGTSTLTVHMIDGRIPNPSTDLIFGRADTSFECTIDGSLAIENCSFMYHGGTAAVSAFRVRPFTTGAANTFKFALKNCRAFGSSGNGFQLYDALVIALDNCYGCGCFYDIINYSSFISTGTKAQWVTFYERNSGGHSDGYAGWRAAPVASNSNNISTAHSGIHGYRVETRGHTSDDSFIADVGGAYTMNFGIETTQSLGTSLFQNGFWYQKLSGEGSADAKMILIGCSGEAYAAGKRHFSNSNDTETAASLGEIHLSDWLGREAVATFPGTIVKNYETGATLIS